MKTIHQIKLAWVYVLVSSILVMICTACGGNPAATIQSGTPTPTATLVSSPLPTLTVTATAATNGTCKPRKDGSPPAVTSLRFPPNTISYGTEGAIGASIAEFCTPGITAAAITAFMNATLPTEGWRAINPAKDNISACGAETSSYWQWIQGNDAFGFAVVPSQLPYWGGAFCDRVNH